MDDEASRKAGYIGCSATKVYWLEVFAGTCSTLCLGQKRTKTQQTVKVVGDHAALGPNSGQQQLRAAVLVLPVLAAATVHIVTSPACILAARQAEVQRAAPHPTSRSRWPPVPSGEQQWRVAASAAAHLGHGRESAMDGCDDKTPIHNHC